MLGVSGTGCDDPGETSEATYLIVQVAGTQPQTASLGVPVAIQQNGGTTLRMRTVAGSLRLTEDSAPSTTACVPVPASKDGILYIDVIPDDAEALLFVDLVGPPGDASTSTTDAAGDGGADELLAECPGAALRNRILPVGGRGQQGSTDAGEDASPSDAAVTEAAATDATDGSPGTPDASDAASGMDAENDTGIDAAPTDGGAE